MCGIAGFYYRDEKPVENRISRENTSFFCVYSSNEVTVGYAWLLTDGAFVLNWHRVEL